jgi:flagellar hook-basal body complex protein FliE
MSNLTIENIAGSLSSGNVDGILGKGAAGIAAPEGATLQAMANEGMQTPDSSVTGGFGDMLAKSIEKVNEAQHAADTSMKELAAGRTKNIHETMLTIEKADASLKLMMQVRNKVLDAYKEIMRMQV